MCLQFLSDMAGLMVFLLSARTLGAEAGMPRISAHLRALFSKEQLFVHFALNQANCNLCPIEVHVVWNLPTASVGSVFELVAMILPGIAILTTEMCF